MKGGSLKQLFTVYGFALTLVIVIGIMLLSGKVKSLEDIFETCWIGQEPKNGVSFVSKYSSFRGSNYFLTADGKKAKYCVLTTWAITHIFLYAVIGYFFPGRFWETFLIGVGYEILEWLLLDCHDLLDIAWNSLGFLVGLMVKKYL